MFVNANSVKVRAFLLLFFLHLCFHVTTFAMVFNFLKQFFLHLKLLNTVAFSSPVPYWCQSMYLTSQDAISLQQTNQTRGKYSFMRPFVLNLFL